MKKKKKNVRFLETYWHNRFINVKKIRIKENAIKVGEEEMPEGHPFLLLTSSRVLFLLNF